jgi:hypothetical protein
LYRITSRYTDTIIEIETAGNGTDRHVIVSKDTAVIAIDPGLLTASSWMSTRNVIALIMALISISNLFLESPLLSHFAAWVFGVGQAPSLPANGSAAKINATKNDADPLKPPAAPSKPGFGFF